MYPIEWITCCACGLDWPVGMNASSGVERETRCPRCLCAVIAALTRENLGLQYRLGVSIKALHGMPLDF